MANLETGTLEAKRRIPKAFGMRQMPRVLRNQAELASIVSEVRTMGKGIHVGRLALGDTRLRGLLNPVRATQNPNEDDTPGWRLFQLGRALQNALPIIVVLWLIGLAIYFL